jgi:hypothetical protein
MKTYSPSIGSAIVSDDSGACGNILSHEANSNAIAERISVVFSLFIVIILMAQK